MTKKLLIYTKKDSITDWTQGLNHLHSLSGLKNGFNSWNSRRKILNAAFSHEEEWKSFSFPGNKNTSKAACPMVRSSLDKALELGGKEKTEHNNQSVKPALTIDQSQGKEKETG